MAPIAYRITASEELRRELATGLPTEVEVYTRATGARDRVLATCTVVLDVWKDVYLVRRRLPTRSGPDAGTKARAPSADAALEECLGAAPNAFVFARVSDDGLDPIQPAPLPGF